MLSPGPWAQHLPCLPLSTLILRNKCTKTKTPSSNDLPEVTQFWICSSPLEGAGYAR